MPFAIFLKIDGVPGESQDAKHKDEIDVLAWSWGLNRTVSEGKVNIEGRTGSEGKVSIEDLSIDKLVDKATPKLIALCASGALIKEAFLTVRERAFEFLKVSLTNGIITAVKDTGSIEDPPTECVAINFAEVVKVEYTPQTADGSPGTPVSTGWDVSAMKPV